MDNVTNVIIDHNEIALNNYYDAITGLGAVDNDFTDSFMLAEGNYFKNAAYPFYKSNNAGSTYAPFTGSGAGTLATCSKYIGRDCIPNQQVSSGSACQPVVEMVWLVWALTKMFC
ncbi:hypothetical protein FBU59_002564 [Linderina macrospora]|uniref:Uncharacterized protein n=1 Tax=Linderina macrospora TaxID=4868 RepID=A0ACC1JAU1_9FUNG|nr:hypothetical protein FBU59_002564 [Linderina macrospora]